MTSARGRGSLGRGMAVETGSSTGRSGAGVFVGRHRGVAASAAPGARADAAGVLRARAGRFRQVDAPAAVRRGRYRPGHPLVLVLDGREVEPTEQGFLLAVAHAAGSTRRARG